MADSIMLNKAKDFAVVIVSVCRNIKATQKETVFDKSTLALGNIHRCKHS